MKTGIFSWADLCKDKLYKQAVGNIFVQFAVLSQAQKTVSELQAQLDLLKTAGDSPQADTEDVAQLKVL